jgi:hypothetical protein
VGSEYDVFLSHTEENKPGVELLAARLKEEFGCDLSCSPEISCDIF